MKVVIGSKSDIKIEAVRQSFKQVFPNVQFEYIPMEAASGVSKQPKTLEETKHGAENRAKACQAACSDADYFVGLEGGLEMIEGEYWTSAWMCIISKGGRIGFGRTGAYLLPQQITKLINEGVELAHASDQIFNDPGSGKKFGAITKLTSGVMDRAEFYRHALIFALIPHVQPALYEE